MASADISLFKNATWLFTSPIDSPSLPALLCLTQELGASRFIIIEPEEHDILVSLISHVPQLLSTALAAGVSSSEEYLDAVQLAGGGFKDMTRLASSPWLMWGPILKDNRAALIRPLSKVRDLLDEMIRDLLTSESDRIEPIFEKSNKARQTYEDRALSQNDHKDMDAELLVDNDAGKAWLDNSLGYRTIRTTSNTSLGHMRLALLLLANLAEIKVDVALLSKESNMVQQIADLVGGKYETTWTADGLPVKGVTLNNSFYAIP